MASPAPDTLCGFRPTGWGMLLAFFLGMTAPVWSADVTTPAPITDPAQLWSMPDAAKSLPHPVHLEARVNFYDPIWKLLWIENHGRGGYVPITGPIPNLRAGDWVLIEGVMIPETGLDPSRVRVTVLRSQVPVEPLRANGCINNVDMLAHQVVVADAYVDDQQLVTPEHLRLSLIVDNRPAIAWVKPPHPELPPEYVGHFIRLTGVYSPRFDPTHTQTTIEIWVSRAEDIIVQESIERAPAFEIPVTPIDRIYQVPLNTQARVQGVVMSHDPGNTMTIRDGTGEIIIRSIQRQRLVPGTPVEAVGRVASSGPRIMLLGAYYRRAASGPAAQAPHDVLATVEEVRGLTPEEAAAGRRVRLAGLVTWMAPQGGYFFLQDLTGGVRVQFAKPPPSWNMQLTYLRIEGVTAAGRFAPTVVAEHCDSLGTMSEPDPKLITYDEAITGQQEGQWVQMRGFIDHIVADGMKRSIYLITPSGSFVAVVTSGETFAASPGTLVRIRGVCETMSDESGWITGITLQVPVMQDVTIEEEAPADPFDLPLRSIRWVSDLSNGPNLLRVHTAGTVIHAVAGKLAYVQEKNAVILMLGKNIPALAPGDRIEAVGIMGREGVRAILREATFRRTGHNPAPQPVRLEDPARPLLALDSRLVSATGTVIDVLRQPGRTRFTLQSGNTIFEANLNAPESLREIRIGQVLGLTGIYRLVFDDARQWRGFELQLRSGGDVAVLAEARFWTIERALIVSGVLAAVVLLGLAWITALRRRVGHQTAQIREQLERQARLEQEVQRAARLESLGTLAGGIAHDFNNVLTVVLGNITLLMSDRRVMDRAGEYLREVERAARRARELTQHLLTFAKGGDPLRGATVLSDIARQATTMVLHGTNVRCEYDIAPDLWAAYVDKDQMAQAIQNLALNAVQAMPRGGLLRVSVHNEEIVENAKPGLTPGRYVKLVLTDTGEGIAAENLSRIFDPYFTTRKEKTGLGLSTVYSIIRRHHGRIEAASTPGIGTTFILWLPTTDLPVMEAPAPVAEPGPAEAAEAAAKPLAPIQPPEGAARPKPRVLLMDDEESIRRVVEIVLQRLGCEAVVVADGEAALREFENGLNQGRPLDLLVLDLTIPGGVGGREVIERIRERDPNVPAIVSSGYSNDPVLAHYADYGFQAMVQKPYDVRQLAAVISEMVGAGRRSAAPA